MTIYFCTWLGPVILSVATPAAVGDSLFVHGYYQEAALEYQRQLAQSDLADSSDRALLYLKLGLALGAAGDVSAASEPLRTVSDLNPDMGTKAQLALAGFYARESAYARARVELSDLLLFASDSSTRAELYSWLGWLALQEQDLMTAAQCYEKAGRTHLAEAVRHIPQSGMKNENLALLLSSLVPGTGEVYAGQPLTGVLSFMVTGTCAGGVILAARSDDWLTAAIIFTTLFFRFYNGSRTNAVDFCQQFNRNRLRSRIDQLTTKHRLEPDWWCPRTGTLRFEGVRGLVGPVFPRPTPDRKGSGTAR